MKAIPKNTIAKVLKRHKFHLIYKKQVLHNRLFYCQEVNGAHFEQLLQYPTRIENKNKSNFSNFD